LNVSSPQLGTKITDGYIAIPSKSGKNQGHQFPDKANFPLPAGSNGMEISPNSKLGAMGSSLAVTENDNAATTNMLLNDFTFIKSSLKKTKIFVI
jgi:hypothetical protein